MCVMTYPGTPAPSPIASREPSVDNLDEPTRSARPAHPVRPPTAPTRSSSSIVESVLKTCRRVDRDVCLSSAVYVENGVLIKVRAGMSSSPVLLRGALKAAFPLATVDVQSSCLDGALEATISVPHDEHRVARAQVAQLRVLKVLWVVGWLLMVGGAGAWVAGALPEEVDVREL